MEKLPSDPISILKRHIDLNPAFTIVASAHSGEQCKFDVSSPANLVDLVFLHKLLGMRIEDMLSTSMKAVYKQEPAQEEIRS